MPEQKHILIIEDQVEFKGLLVEYFSRNGFTVTAADDGIQGVKIAEEKLPDIVITDLLLPGEHGIDVTKKIKNELFLPVIIVSGVYKHDELNFVMDDFFVDAYFEKPVDLKALLRKVNAIIAERQKAKNDMVV